MTATAAKIGEPARHGRWGLTADSMGHPTEYIVLTYPAPGRRHREPFTVVQRLPYAPLSSEELAAQTGMPSPTAASLLTSVAVKLASPKAAASDLGGRPVR